MSPLVGAVRFATEVAVLAALAVAGAAVGWPLAIALPAAFAFVWARWVAPKSASRLAGTPRFVLEVVLFVAAGTVLAATTSPVVGVALALVGVATSVATRG